MRAVAATRHGWYKAIEASEHNVDKATQEYQQELRDQHAIDNWPRRNCEFVSDNVRLWSRYLLRHDNSAESFVSSRDTVDNRTGPGIVNEYVCF